MSGGLRFAMVTTFYPPHHFGGDAVAIRRLSHALARRGHAVEVIHDVDAFALLHPGPEPAPEPPPPGVHTHPLRSRWGALSCLATQQTGHPLVHGRRIREILGEGDFDVIHFHNVSLVGGPGVLGYGDAIKLYTAHEHWLVCPTHVLWRHGREVCTGRQCLRCQLHHRRPPQLWRRTGLLEREARHVDAFFSPSAFSAAKHAEFGFPRPLEVMPYFLPDESGAEDGAEREDDRHGAPYFLFVGRLERIKGLQDVIPLFGADAPADLLVVGTGNFEPELRRLAAERPRVRFLGARRSDELRALYRGALAVLVPSICYETFGITLLEAFRDHTPVVARDLGPLPEIVRESGGGLVFRDREALAAALQRLAGDPPLRRKLGEAGHAALRERWSEGVVVDRYLERIGQLAERRGHQRALGRLT